MWSRCSRSWNFHCDSLCTSASCLFERVLILSLSSLTSTHLAPKGHGNVLEAKALQYGLDMIGQTFPRAISHSALQIEVRVDNTSVCCRAPKGSSKSFHLNQAIMALQAHCVWRFITSIKYVHTTVNHADWVSRRNSFLEAHLHNPLMYQRLRNCHLEAYQLTSQDEHCKRCIKDSTDNHHNNGESHE